MNLPKKDRYGKSYLSYSQINMFLKYPDDYYRAYILNEPFEGNQWTEFGSKVGKALELDQYDDFSDQETYILKQCTRLDRFEQKVTLDYGDFYVLGFIDTCTEYYTHIIDYKTGGKNKEQQYLENDYWQLCYYALAIKQMTGRIPDKAQVNFIRRKGYEHLTVAPEMPIILDVDISMNRLKDIYWQTIDIAKEIEQFYNDSRNIQ